MLSVYNMTGMSSREPEIFYISAKSKRSSFTVSREEKKRSCSAPPFLHILRSRFLFQMSLFLFYCYTLRQVSGTIHIQPPCNRYIIAHELQRDHRQ